MAISTQTMRTVEVEYQRGEQPASVARSGAESPEELVDAALKQVPLRATIHRIGGWTGGVEDRPEGGHEDGVFDTSGVPADE
jgi:hypothetical protein